MWPLLKDSLSQAIRALKSSVLRTTLTMLGIIIGVSSVVIMLTVGRGAQTVILDEIESFGSNLFFVTAGGSDANPIFAATLDIIKNRDIDDMRKPGALPAVELLSPFTRVERIEIKEGVEEQQGINVWGVDRDYFLLQNVEIEEGRIWTTSEEKSEKKVAILGGAVDENIYGEDRGPLVGKRLSLKGQTYTIIGVIKEQEGLLSSFGNENNEYIFVPTPVAQKLLVNTPTFVWGIALKARSESELDTAREQVRQLLRKNHKLDDDEEDDFTILSQDEFVEVFLQVSTIFALFLAAVAAISLFVGGIGIMNIMLVVVSERITEIGVRKAVGAKRSDILLQFLIEAILLTGIGGLIGIIVGLSASYAISVAGALPFIIDPMILLFAFVGSSLFGLVFGLWPAVQASKQDPIVAIRHR